MQRYDAPSSTHLVELASPHEAASIYHDRRPERLQQQDHDSDNPSKWYGAPSRETAIARLSSGWPEGAQRIASISSQIQMPRLPSIRRRPCWGEEGDEISLDRLRDGRDDFYRSARLAPGTCRAQSRYCILIDICGNWGATAEALAWAGAAGLALSDAIASSGRVVSILAWFRSDQALRDGSTVFAAVTLKPEGEPLALGTLAAAASPGFFRSIGFNIIECQGPAVPTLGRVVHSLPSVWQPPSNAIHVPPIRNQADASAWLADQSAKITDPQQFGG